VETIQSSNAHGVSAAYTWDDQNRLSTVVDNNLPGQNTTTYTYDNASNVATVKIPNGLTSTFTYDALNRLTELSTPPVADYKYTLGLTGNRTSATELSGRALQWSYDNIYRLTGETIAGDPANNGGDNGSATYTLDPVGNRTSATSTLSGIDPITGSYNPNDQLSSESYDANGNVLFTGGISYTYDSENHMLTASGNGKVVTMVYDAFGNRVAKTVNGVTTQYLVEDEVNPTGYPQVVDELVGPIGSGVVTRQYTYGLQRISENLSPALTGNNTWTPSFYVYDGGGSVRNLTNTAGVITDEYEYDAYGNSFTKVGTTPNNYLYRGEQFDSDLDLYYLRARYYNPSTGRFLSRDPEDGYTNDPASLHKYLYANGDPVNLADPTGRAGEAVVKPYTPGALEYGLLIGLISLQAAKSLPQLSGGINDLWYSNTLNLIGYMFATKRDVKQARDAGKQVGRERGCRSPEPDDFETAHDMMESEKGPNGMVTYEQLLEIWREILCGGGR
jgi:RHS repeat-associated protein